MSWRNKVTLRVDQTWFWTRRGAGRRLERHLRRRSRCARSSSVRGFMTPRTLIAKDIKDTIDAVRNLPESNGKVALLGYCLGALMVFMTAVRNNGIDAAVCRNHGGDTEKYLEKSTAHGAPFSCILPRRMEFISRAAQAEISGTAYGNQMRRPTAT